MKIKKLLPLKERLTKFYWDGLPSTEIDHNIVLALHQKGVCDCAH